MSEQNKMDELFKLAGIKDEHYMSEKSRKVAMRHLRHKPYQNDLGENYHEK